MSKTIRRSSRQSMQGAALKAFAIAASLLLSDAALAQQGLPPKGFDRPPPDNRHPGENYRKYDLNNTSDRSDPNSVANLYSRAISLTRCIGKKHSDKLSGLLDQPFAGAREKLAAQDIGRTARMCSDGEVQMSMRMLRGAAAEALLVGMKTPETVEVADLKAFHDAMPKSEGAADQSAQDVQRIVECQVANAPGTVRKMIETAPGAVEDEALRVQLATASSICGSVTTADPEMAIVYRTYLAEALYHLAHAASGDHAS